MHMHWDVMEIVGLCLAASHVVFLLLLVSWFGLNKPQSWSQCKSRLRAAMHGRPGTTVAPPLPRAKTL
jgi:hypothetical protein